MKLINSKKADMPYWLVMLLYTLAGLVIALLIVGLISGKLNDFIEWLGEIL